MKELEKEDNILMKTALRYVSCGFAVFPLQKNAKIPIQYSNGVKDATNNTWCLSGIIADDNQTADTYMSGGSKSLSATLDRVRFHTENGRTLDGGSIAILTSE